MMPQDTDPQQLANLVRRVHELEMLVRPLAKEELRYGQPQSAFDALAARVAALEAEGHLLQRVVSDNITETFTSTTFADITNATVDITVQAGSLLKIFFKPDDGEIALFSAYTTSSQALLTPAFKLLIDGVDKGEIDCEFGGASGTLRAILAPKLVYFEYVVPAADTLTIKIQADNGASEEINISNLVLVVEEWSVPA